MASLDALSPVLHQLFADPLEAQRPIRALFALEAVRAGRPLPDAATELNVQRASVARLAKASDPVVEIFQCSFASAGDDHPKNRSARRSLGQLLLGHVAEQVFERLYKRELGTDELALEDSREDRTDTDYRVLNGLHRPVFRINIKFHGTLFRRAQELVGLDPRDCFALATYKIFLGLRKEESERLPYIFLVVSVPGLTGEDIGSAVPDSIARFATLIRTAKSGKLRKRDIEDRIVSRLASDEAPSVFRPVRDDVIARLEAADWRAISATRADRLLRQRLFDRVYAVRVRGFAQNYRNAELDMHFSLISDLTSLHDFLTVYKEGGLHLLASKLSRGDI